jgi:hypothetical protein
MNVRLVKEPISHNVVSEVANQSYGDMVKGVADIERGIIAIGGEWHSDANALLKKDGSDQENNWGFNFYINRPKGEDVEYVSMINIRPAQGNKDMYIKNTDIREKVKAIINKLLIK